MNDQCICGHLDTSHDMHIGSTGTINGCMETGCHCYGFIPGEFSQEDGYCEDLLNFIDNELEPVENDYGYCYQTV